MKGLLNAVFAMAGSGLSQDTDLQRTESPECGWTALVMERERGVGMPVARHVRLKRKGWPLWQTAFVMQDRPEISLSWESESRLLIHAPEGRVLRRVERVDEVEIDVRVAGVPGNA